MSPSENEDETKVRQEPEPLCLCYYPRQELAGKDNLCGTYISSTRGSESSKTQNLAQGQKPTRGVPWKLPPARRTLQRGAPSSSDDNEGKVRTQRSDAQPRRSNIKRNIARRSKETNLQRKSRTWRFGREPVHHLTSYLLSSVQATPSKVDEQLPPLTDVLDTITDAWSDSRNFQLHREPSAIPMKEESQQRKHPESSCHALARRRSVPEEIIRKFSVTSERTSESETNATMPEITPPSSKQNEGSQEKENLTRKPIENHERLRASVFSKKIDMDVYTPVLSRSFRLVEDPDIVHSAEEGSSDSDSDAPGMERYNTIKRAPLRRGSVIESSREGESASTTVERASQNDYYRNGQGILKLGAVEKSSQTGDCIWRSPQEDGGNSGTTPSAREESESAESSETISSPRMCTQPLSSSDNQSSDSENIKCTCAEMTSSKDTSTDPNHSGKSTLSQTVSDKSTSTQDSTASINSVSSQGSSMSTVTDSSSTDVDPRTSAKETTSPDHTPRSPPGRGRPDRERDRFSDSGRGGHHSQERFCPQHKPARRSRDRSTRPPKGSKNQAIQGQLPVELPTQTGHEFDPIRNSQVQTTTTIPLTSQNYEWAQLSEEELCLIQQQRHQKFIENNRNFESPIVAVPGKVSVCTSTGSSYHVTGKLEDVPFMVPRYSALPRTMSMVVNSSFEGSHFSDSDCQSLADSLEDGDNRREPLYDTKRERKPVRGDIGQALTERNGKTKRKEPRGRAYFFAIDSDGGAELVTNIHKIPELPEEIKNKIHERHINICKSHESKELGKDISKHCPKGRHRLVKRKTKPKLDDSVRPIDLKSQNNQLTNNSTQIKKRTPDQQIKKGRVVSKFLSKIPTPVYSGPMVPERKDEKFIETEPVIASSQNERRAEKRKENEAQKTTAEKPQAVIHPSLTTSASHVLPTHSSPSVPLSTSSSTDTQVPPLESASTNQKLPCIDIEAVTKHRLSLISSLESTASVLKTQNKTTWNRPQQAAKRSTKFQQRFAVIPEERSSSLTSSAEEHRSEKNRRRSLPVKLTEPATSPTFLSGSGNADKSFRRYTMGSLSSHVIAKLMGRPLKAIPCVQRGPNNENQQIIIFSPKDPPGPNSSKGRDALLAMNREDFNRLSKGWMNFYLLKESSDSENAPEDCDEEPDNALEVEKESEDVHQREKENKSHTIVCRIPSMEKDPPTTSGSGTDETCFSPGQRSDVPPLQLSSAQLNKSYSLLLKNPETSCFQLQECPIELEKTENTIRTSTTKARNTASRLNYISEESEFEQDSSEILHGKTLTSETREIKVQEDVFTSQIDETVPDAEIVKSDNQPSKESEKPPKIETKEASTSTERKYETKGKGAGETPIKLSAPLKLSSSNTVLTTKKPIKVSPRKTPKSSARSCSLPELRVEEPRRPTPIKTQSLVDTLPRVGDTSSASEATDSDSTVYLNAPSPQLPRLPIEDCYDCCSNDSSTDSETPRINAPAAQRERQYVPLRRRPLPFRPKNRFGFYDSLHGKKGGAGWSVTVEGTLAFPRNRPDVQMRLSFPEETGVPIVSQSDSGFVEEREVKSRPATLQKQQWTVTVKNPQSGGGKEKHFPVCHLPNLSQYQQERSTRRGPKENGANKCEAEQADLTRKLSMIWPKVQEVIENELMTITGDLIKCDMGKTEEPMMSVEGRAMSFDTKPRVPKMSERDVTRNNTARSQSVTARQRTQR